jgi:hypothetical protein
VALADKFPLVNVYTGKRVYTSMLIGSITTTTEKDTENVLLIRLLCRHIKFATVTTVQISTDPTTLANPQQTLPVAPKGTQQLQSNPPAANVPAVKSVLTGRPWWKRYMTGDLGGGAP